MKRIIKKYFHFLLSNSQLYRRRKGGVWYKYQESDVSGMAAPTQYWTQGDPYGMWDKEIERERY